MQRAAANAAQYLMSLTVDCPIMEELLGAQLHFGTLGFTVQLLQEMPAHLREYGVGGDFVTARPRKIHGKNLFDASGARRHDHDAVTEQERLVDIVGHEEYSLAVALPEFEE